MGKSGVRRVSPRVSEGRSLEEGAKEPVAVHREVLGDVAEDGVERSDLERIVSWDGDVMLATLLRGQTDVASALAVDLVTEAAERLGEIGAADVTRQLHAAMTSSRTQCSRIIFGRLASSGK
jgi:hypothetical protein